MKLTFTITGYRILLSMLFAYRWLFSHLHDLPWVETYGDIYVTLGDVSADIRIVKAHIKDATSDR